MTGEVPVLTPSSCLQPSADIVIPEDPLLGCECGPDGCSSASSKCCPDTNDASFPYTRFGRLHLEVGMPIFECNKRCTCSPEHCVNRVVQRGRKVRKRMSW